MKNKTRTPKLELIFPFIFAFVVFIADYLSKGYIVSTFPMPGPNNYAYPYGGFGLFENLFGVQASIVHTINKGAAWSVFSDHQMILQGVRIGLVFALVLYLFLDRRAKGLEFPLLLIITGALGNVIDYFRFGYVIDMIKVVLWGYHYPVFNIADISIFLGVALFCWKTLFGKENEAQSQYC